MQFAVPQDVRILKSFLALCNFCAEFNPNFATIADPLTKLLRKPQPWIWTQDQQDSLKRLKSLMAEPPALGYPDYFKPLFFKLMLLM
jgi:hypothetical protein